MKRYFGVSFIRRPVNRVDRELERITRSYASRQISYYRPTCIESSIIMNEMH